MKGAFFSRSIRVPEEQEHLVEPVGVVVAEQVVGPAGLDGLGQGLVNGPRPLPKLWEDPPPGLKTAIENARPLFTHAAKIAREEKRDIEERKTAVRLLGSDEIQVASPPRVCTSAAGP